MKANEAKSKFVYPDKLYARTNDNITLDISYAPQIMEAVEYVRTDAFIEKVAEYLSYHLDTSKIDVNYKFDFIEDFKKAMEV